MSLTWKEAFEDKKFKIYLAAWVLGLVLFIFFLPYFLNTVILYKQGMQIDDWSFKLLTPRNWSVPIFLFTIGAPNIFVLFNFKEPLVILTSIQCYVVVSFARMMSIYLFTLEAPEGIIPLVDPFLAEVAYGGNEAFNKDLFFSGHASTLFLLFLLEKRVLLKRFFLMSTILIGLLLVWQRVHYTIDILGALIVAWLVFRGIAWLNLKTIIYKSHLTLK